MNNNDFAMLIVAILFVVLASGGMNMITGSSSVTAEAGSVIEIPWSYIYDNDFFFGSSTSARIIVDEQWTGGMVDSLIWTQSVSAGQTYSDTFNYRVPATEGLYVVEIRSEDWSGDHWVDTGSFGVSITVTPPPYEEPDDPDVPVDPPESETPTDPEEDDGSGVVPDDTPIDQTVEAAILGDSLLDKISVLWDLIVTFFENLIGAK